MYKHKTNRSRWDFRERELAGRRQVEGISPDKSPERIERRLQKDEAETLELVARCRRMWAAGISLRKIEAIVGRHVWPWIENSSFYDSNWDKNRRAKP